VTPRSISLWAQKPIALSGTRNAVSETWPTPICPAAACAQGKNVTMLPGCPVSSPK
jgi:hypothetical protein